MRDESFEDEDAGDPTHEEDETEKSLGDDMIESDADPLDTEVEDADFFLGDEGGGEDA
jgi:hypothetical protein